MKFATELRRRRTEAGLTLREVCAGTGLDDSLVSLYECGKRRAASMTLWSAKALSDYFGWPLEDMVRLMEADGSKRRKKRNAKT